MILSSVDSSLVESNSVLLLFQHVNGMSGRLHTLQPEKPHIFIFNIKVCGEESALPQLLCGEDWSEALSADPLSYAQQLAAPPAVAPLPDEEEDSVRVRSVSEAGDYGIVLSAAVAAEISSYRTQEHTVLSVKACEDEPDDQDQIFLDWSPETQELNIPLMGLLGQIQTEAVPLLPNLILRQSSEPEPEPDDFIKMERDWGLVIHSSPD